MEEGGSAPSASTTSTSSNTTSTTPTRGAPASKKMRYDLNAAVLAATSQGPDTAKLLKIIQAREHQLNKFIELTGVQAGARRVFQQLPKHLKRRAMSHNLRRIPRRVRDLAQKEMEKCNTQSTGPKEKKRCRKYKRRPSYLLRDYERRQREYQWLETHIWHAKRMKMTSLWGYKLAEYPRAKGVRSTFRASEHQCTIHDASYFGVIELSGSQADIASVFSVMTPPDSPSVLNMMFADGSRAGNISLHHSGAYPRGLIAPISFLWKPRASNDEPRNMWMWVHPSAFDEALLALKSAVESKSVKVQVKSLKDQLLRFELTGAKAHSALYSVLRVAQGAQSNASSSTDTPEKLWELLADLRTPASLPCGIVVPLTVDDPRINFPPRKHKISRAAEEAAQKGVASFFANVNLQLALQHLTTPLWSEEARSAASKVEPQATVVKKITEKIMNPSVTFSTIPVLLIQRPEGLSRGYGAGWDIVLPSGWGAAFWVSLIFAGARPIGQRDKYKIQTEQGLPFFPYDFPDTRAYTNQAVLTAKQLAIKYAKKPPAKRTNYKKLGIFSPFRPPWESLLGLQNKISISLPADTFNYGNKPKQTKPLDKPETTSTNNNNNKTEPEKSKPTKTKKDAQLKGDETNKTKAKTATTTTTTTETQVTKQTTTPSWKEERTVEFAVLRGTKATELVEVKRDTPRQERHKQKNMGMVWVPKTQPMEDAHATVSPHLVRVTIKMARIGTPKFNEEDCIRWRKTALATSTSLPLPPQPSTLKPAPSSSKKSSTPSNSKPAAPPTKKQLKEDKKKKKEADVTQLLNGPECWDAHPEAPHRKVIGYITSGAYSHVRTSGSGIGFCAASHIPQVFNKPNRPRGLVLIRNIDSRYYQAAFISIKE